ncbi:MAG: 2,3-bisphosphoglycerate-independent phosphoglycerate mutase [Candidatus Moranbacteria bacterium]|jgi:2,3-bisphosphoglycerate-independent phosphoglycerate mutase|nr:2,3-bisphosphoglycerate-independent phosphoglycerate mutase [Candidatus Moranbacteria bacterium]
MKKTYKPVVLAILDGWGETPEKRGNAIANATLPTIEKIERNYPKMLLQASGMAVGVPWGEEGNSEVGHQTIGAGQIIYQNLPRIDIAIEEGTFFQNEKLVKGVEWAKNNNSNLHLMGLLSDGGIHSHINHLFALLDLIKDQKFERVFFHIFTDGRDTGTNEGVNFTKKLQRKIESAGIGKIATISGRYYAMDRNNNYDRIKLAFDAMVEGRGILEKDPVEALEKQYKKNNKGDEYIKPIVLVDKNDEPITKIKDNDSIIFFNYREDRARQITKAFILEKFDKFGRDIYRPKNLKFTGMTLYEKGLPMEVAFPAQKVDMCLGKALSENGKKQLRIAETEKYAHVTYFFNVGKEKPFPGEDRILVPSKNLASYADIPEMSANEITDKLLTEIEKNKYDFILVNYANPDMVGHTGVLKAGIKAVEEVDRQLERLIPKVIEKGGCLLITADHGNVEEMINLKTGEKDTEHSQNPVPLWLVAPDNHQKRERREFLSQGMLSDLAPTVLDLLGLPKPKEMTGESLLSQLK